MQIIIMAGGLGTRLGRAYENTPKSLIRIMGKPFLQYQVELLRESGIRNIVLCIGHLGSQVKAYFGSGEKFGVNILYSEEGEKLLGTGGALKKAAPLLEDSFFLMWGDSYLLLDYQHVWRKFIEAPGEGLMVVYRNDNLRVKSNVIVKNGRVVLYDKWKTAPDMVYIDNGLSVFNKSLLEEIPSRRVYAVENIFKKWSEEGRLAAYETEQKFYEIGSLAGLKEFEALISGQSNGKRIE